MNRVLKIWHVLLLIMLIILVFRFDRLIVLAELLINYLGIFFSNPQTAFSQTDFQLADHFISLLLFIILPVVLFLFRKKMKFIFTEVNLTYTVFLIIIAVFIYAPLISTTNPDLQFTLSESKLLPPLNSRDIVILKNKPADDKTDNFMAEKNFIFENLFESDLIPGNLIEKRNDSLIVYQKAGVKSFLFSDFEEMGKEPVIKKQFFILGSDEYGRDIFSRLVYGTRLSILIGLCSVLISLIIGVLLGFAAGYYGALLNSILNRFSDMFLAFPVIFLIILVVALMGNSLFTIILILGAAGWMTIFKIVRSEIASLKQKDFIVASKNLGNSDFRILFREMMPLMLSPVIVSVVFLFANVIIAEAALSYLGLGLGNIYPSWGAMIHQGQNYLSQAWWISLFPCIFLFVTLLTVNFLGRDLEKLINPQLK